VSRKSIPKRKVGIPLDKLLAAHAAGDDARLGALVGRYGGQFEHDVLRERTVASMRAAKRRGEHIGRPSALTPAQVREAKKMLDRGEVLATSRGCFAAAGQRCIAQSHERRIAELQALRPSYTPI